MSLQVKAKIVDISYDRDNNLFRLLIEDIENKKTTQVAIKGTDWGVASNVPDDVIKEFCDNMKGQEKNLHIETEQSSLRDAEKDDKGVISQKEINKTYENLDNFPINEVMNVLHKDAETDEN